MTPGDGKDLQQAGGSRQEGTGSGQPAAGSQQQAAGRRQQAAGCLDPGGRAGRALTGLFVGGAALVLGLRLVSTGAPWTERLLVFPFAFFGALGLLQAAAET